MALVPIYRTWVAGEIVVASYMNTNIRDAGNFWLARPLCILRQATLQSIPNNAYTALLFDVEDLDRDGGHSTVTNTSRYTSPTAGWFLHTGAYVAAANATGQRGTHWSVNGSLINAGASFLSSTAAGGPQIPAPAQPLFLNGSGDYSELAAVQNSGAGLNTAVTAANQSGMSILWISTA